MPAIGALTVFAHADVGAITTQALINPLLGVDALEMLATHDAEETLARVLETDPDTDSRQVTVVDRHGRVSSRTGAQCHPSSVHRIWDGFAVAGNILVGSDTLDAMAQLWKARADESLEERLLSALEAS